MQIQRNQLGFKGLVQFQVDGKDVIVNTDSLLLKEVSGPQSRRSVSLDYWTELYSNGEKLATLRRAPEKVAKDLEMEEPKKVNIRA